MSASNHFNDILQEIPDEDLQKVWEVCHKSKMWAPYASNLILNVIRWRKHAKHHDAFSVLSPVRTSRNDLYWTHDGSIIILTKKYACNLFIFSSKDYSEGLYNGLRETCRIDWTKRIMCYCVHSKHLPIIDKIIKEKKSSGQIESVKLLDSFLFYKPLEEAINLKYIIPPEVEVKKLQLEDAKLIGDLWPSTFPGAQNYFEMLIEMNGGYGVYLKENGRLVCWVLKDIMNHLGMLQTLDGYKGKGYAKLIVKVLSRSLAEEGFDPFATCLVENGVSQNIFKSIGFRNIGESCYIILK